MVSSIEVVFSLIVKPRFVDVEKKILELSRACVHNLQEFYKSTLCLAYQSLGVVYGDLSTSPIYVYKSTFSGRLRLFEEDHEILGVLSLIIWTLTLISLCKYVIFVLSADDKGEGAESE